MDFSDKINQFSKRIETLKNNLTTEEATKTALIMPLFQILEYDIFNPLEFMPEFIADVGVKKGEKVDYAILKDGKPLILIEAKCASDKLKKHDAQLFRYFTATEAKFAILTNGIIYKFFTDLEEKNKMDEKPFLVLNLLNMDDNKISHLKKFTKNSFDIDTIFNIASELKYTSLIKSQLNMQLENPSDEFVRFIINDFYNGIKTQNVVEKFRPIVKRSLSQFVNDFMNEKLKLLLENDNEDYEKKKVKDNKKKEKNKIDNDLTKKQDGNNLSKPEIEPKNNILLTEDELKAIDIVQNILIENVSKDEISYKKVKDDIFILYKNDIKNWVCKITLNSSNKTISLPNGENDYLEYKMDEVIDIKELKDDLIFIIKKYIK
ncbi:endonuclease [Clostridioides difficile]|uniref:type I restriction endonuclease n=1 Tax=Clostridioides difficile TaxID=1496 RepID=UPI00146DD55E|nr:type I restriction endonuclease [Clostridioides difficile]MCO4288401.1 type I restriction endonuclease [Clostridioides difficile]NMU18220.1 endonuclease [Clostridioides difficile]HBF0592800.1 type I restriction enzyme HsdR N-terminal domain-containing protein [Clostridioides difficile]HBF4992462.1 type I restriction enzyme HsdR N-terminal domain-containing protein [Clostridioides difficile]HBH3691546.1 type I restriction enzyme HsdR N-terminal domain-containing protein [Clostridioides diffi